METLLQSIRRLTLTQRTLMKTAVHRTRIWGQFANSVRQLHFSSPSHSKKTEDRKRMQATIKPMEEGTEGEGGKDIDAMISGKMSMFPDENTPGLLFDGVPFSQLPIVHIRSSKNNTIIDLTNDKGDSIAMRSCGMEGFKNAKKGTNIAAQVTAVGLSMKGVSKGYKNVRVKISGLGPGRMSSMKGLQMGGMTIVSITDVTPIRWLVYPRPRKARRL